MGEVKTTVKLTNAMDLAMLRRRLIPNPDHPNSAIIRIR